ncbi:von Willebrand factor type A (vWA) domain protein [Caulobacter sp. AP07]|uniref:vWA domain-containing protein n=1 Tax=Caulobacter sp. AP07 TaxID=1144304 RepID=UPI0002721648|nr:VWA domain-containing protein [Caulobacter sp. AP07]EJL29486.1 von Willebrand factor type A (vWA) domain protein [Caulobacter sp. AP07]
MASSGLRILGSTALSLLIAGGASAPSLALSSPGDGAVTPEACAALGYVASSERDHRLTSPRRATMAQGAPVGMAPPPLPIPSIQPRSESKAPAPPPPAVYGYASPVMPSPAFAPQARDTEKYPGAVANPVKRVADEPVSTFSIDVDTAAYANVRRFLNDASAPPRDAVRVEELINYFDYGYARPTAKDAPFKPTVAVVPSPWSKDRQLLHIGVQGYAAPRADQPPLNLVFLIDTSGSMSGEDRLPLAKKALNVLIDQLRPQDRVSMVAYAGSAGAVLSPTDGRSKLKMRCALTALQSGGSTAGGQGLELAYALAKQNLDPKAVNRVILLTDGDFNVGIADPARLKDFVSDQRKSGVYLSVYGFGRGNYNDTMMQALAQNGNGTAAYVDSLQEARKLLRDDFDSALFPIADDVKIQVEFNPAKVAEYRLIGYETRLLNREDFNNDQVDAGEVGSGAAVTAIYEITPVGARPSSDPLRYGDKAPARAGGDELAFLKIRYKPPGGSASKLIERPIGAGDVRSNLAAAPEATRFAVAVAAYGQKLRGDPWVDDGFDWNAVTALAQGARGEDPYGLRAEFVQLTRAAKDVKGS